jgi:osmotically inducible protein OsmC
MTTLEQRTTGKVIYTAKTHTTGGRENGVSRSSDGQLDVKLSTPGTSRPGTNPEQLFAAGWSACFEGALGVAAQRKKIKLSPDVAIDAEVDLHLDKASSSSAPVSTSPFRASSGASRRAWSTMQRGSVPTPRRRRAISR